MPVSCKKEQLWDSITNCMMLKTCNLLHMPERWQNGTPRPGPGNHGFPMGPEKDVEDANADDAFCDRRGNFVPIT